MVGYVCSRLLQGVVTLVGVMVLLFVLFRLMPGDPVAMLVNVELTPAAQAELRRAWGLDAPLIAQFFAYLRNVAFGDWGTSFFYNQPVWEVIWGPLGSTAVIMGPAALIAFLLSVGAGKMVGWHRGSVLERAGSVLPLLVRSTPHFIGAIVALSLFTYWLGLFPSGGMFAAGAASQGGAGQYLTFDFLRHAALPLLTSIVYFMPEPFMIMRTMIGDVKQEHFAWFLRVKGVSDSCIKAHCARNALLPVLSWMSVLGTYAFGAQMIVETVFSWPGLGREMVQAASRHDYPLAQAAFFLMAAVVVALNLLVDVLHTLLDPRLRQA